MNSTAQLFINFWKLLVQRNWLENFPKVHMQCWIYAFTYFGIPRMYCKKPSWSGFNLHAWCQFNYISSWFGHLADTNLNFHKCKQDTLCKEKADNLDSSDTWSGKNAQVVDNGSFETGNYLKQQLRIRFVPFLYRRGPSEDISCFDKNRSIKKKK